MFVSLVISLALAVLMTNFKFVLNATMSEMLLRLSGFLQCQLIIYSVLNNHCLPLANNVLIDEVVQKG